MRGVEMYVKYRCATTNLLDPPSTESRKVTGTLAVESLLARIIECIEGIYAGAEQATTSLLMIVAIISVSPK